MNRGGGGRIVPTECGGRGSPEHYRDVALAALANRRLRAQTPTAVSQVRSVFRMVNLTNDLLRGLSRSGPWSQLTERQRVMCVQMAGLDAVPPVAPPPAGVVGMFDPARLPKRPPPGRPAVDE